MRRALTKDPMSIRNLSAPHKWCPWVRRRSIPSNYQLRGFPFILCKGRWWNGFTIGVTWIRVNDPSAGSPTERWI